MNLGTHAQWIANCADRFVEAHKAEAPDRGGQFTNLAHQIAQARPAELREFAEAYPYEKTLSFAPLMVLAWRIVGNELPDEMAQAAIGAIKMLCDLDESENATEQLRKLQIENQF